MRRIDHWGEIREILVGMQDYTSNRIRSIASDPFLLHV